MVDLEVLTRKLRKLKGYLTELGQFEGVLWDDYLENFQIKRTVERLIQLIVDVAVDINSHAVVDEGKFPPRDAFDSFFQASELGFFPVEFAKKIAPSTGERNIIVHEYEQIDDAVVFDSIDETLQLYNQYLEYMKRLIKE